MNKQKKRVLVISTHPIQYHVSLFSYLSIESNFELCVFYTLGKEKNSITENDFGIIENWNLDLYNGYKFVYITNISIRPSSRKFWGIQNPELLTRATEYNPDIIVVYGWKYFSHLRLMTFFKGKTTIVFRGDSTTIDDKKSFIGSRFRYIILNIIYRYIDYAFSPGKESDKYFKKSGLKDNQIIRVEHAIDVNRFISNTTEEKMGISYVKYLYNIHDGQTVFLFAGKFIDKKNPFLLINAFLEILRMGKDVQLLLVGDGRLKGKILSWIQTLEYDVSSKIHIIPFKDQKELKLFYKAASVYVLPSQGPNETWGLSVNEALACGIPVLVSDKCGCANDLVIDGINGHIFESNNLQDLTDQMIKFCSTNHIKSLVSNINKTIENYSYKSFKLALDQLVLEK